MNSFPALLVLSDNKFLETTKIFVEITNLEIFRLCDDVLHEPVQEFGRIPDTVILVSDDFGGGDEDFVEHEQDGATASLGNVVETFHGVVANSDVGVATATQNRTGQCFRELLGILRKKKW